LGGCHTDGPHLKLKYLLDLERLQRRCAEEIFHVRSPGSAAAIAIHVSGGSGVSWSCGGVWGAPGGGSGGDNGMTPSPAQEVEFPTLREARSFVALLDGYYRLTADAQHYFCREVAPPRLLEDLENQCHGPIRWVPAPPGHPRAGGDAGREGTDPPPPRAGPRPARWAPPGWAQGFPAMSPRRDHGRPCLWQRRVVSPQTRSGRDYKRCQIRRDGDGHLWLSGGPPGNVPVSPQGESLGQGSFTQIYKGVKQDQDEEDGPRQTPVVLKVMDSSHRNCLESFLEAASTMSQLSHKHLVLLHGVSLGKDSVMVQEHVRHGPLDLYLRKHRGAVTTGWKLTVAKQLAYALNYL
ncbi:JAK3 kinase, partial [Machaerirhynchus nigripectus]|nr:JAK3 kinase [Machaerirhynchus nigripectus]